MRQWQRKWSLTAMVLAVLAAWFLQGGPAQSVPPADVGLQAQVAALQSAVAALQGQVSTLQGQVTTLQSHTHDFSQLTGTVPTHSHTGYASSSHTHSELAALSPLAALSDYISVDLAELNGLKGPHIIFEGANVHVRSGSGATDDLIYTNGGSPIGLGNLVIGYNEPGSTYGRSGSHNLVVGPGHSYLWVGGLVAGHDNALLGTYVSIAGGRENVAGSWASSVTGGYRNRTNGNCASVTGGENNLANAAYSSVAGGGSNAAFGHHSTVLGGENNRCGRGNLDPLVARYTSVGGGSGVEHFTEYRFTAMGTCTSP